MDCRSFLVPFAAGIVRGFEEINQALKAREEN